MRRSIVQVFPVNLTQLEQLWKTEVAFYEKLRKLYQPERQTPGDKNSLYFTVARGWTRILPLHILIGDKYLTPILRLESLSFFFFVESESTEADFAIRAIKFTFRGEGQCKSARHILEEKNNALKLANPTGQFSTALTMRLPDGAPMCTATGKLRKEFVKVPFLFFSESLYPLCGTHNNSLPCDHTNARRKSARKTITHIHPALTASPLLGCNNITAQCLNMSAQQTFNTTKPPLNLYSSRSNLHHEGMMPLHEAIACAVDHSDHNYSNADADLFRDLLYLSVK